MSQSLSTTSQDSSESIRKQLFRQAWDYSRRLDQSSKEALHTIDLFRPELQALRKKLRDKCEQIILLPTSSARHKAEELLWKKSFYALIQQCKHHKQLHTLATPLHAAYSAHLTDAASYYNLLLHKLETHFGTSADSLDSSSLEDLEMEQEDVEWLRSAFYRCYLYLGDIARYQVGMGGSPLVAVAYYHHAISLDPTKGAPFNQLAVLAGDRNNCLNAIYYYQRSVTSPHPFEGSEVNLLHILDRNGEQLEVLNRQLEHVREPAVREFSQKLLFLKFLHLQRLFTPNKSKASLGASEGVRGVSEGMGGACEGVISALEACLVFDSQLSAGSSRARVTAALSLERPSSSAGKSEEEEGAFVCLPPDVLLKLAAMAILPSHWLRLQGSSITPAASKFALSVFSTLLHHSLLGLADLLHAALSHGGASLIGMNRERGRLSSSMTAQELMEDGRNMVDILLGREHMEVEISDQKSVASVDGSGSSFTGVAPTTDAASRAKTGGASKDMVKKGRGKTVKSRRYMDRRRRLRSAQEADDDTSDEEGAANLSLSSSEDDLSLLSDSLDEENLDLLESLSETSSSDDEAATAHVLSGASPSGAGGSPTPASLSPQRHLSPPSGSSPSVHGSSKSLPAKPKSRRTITLAANFNPSPHSSRSSQAGQTSRTGQPRKTSPSSSSATAAKPSTKSYAASRAEKRVLIARMGLHEASSAPQPPTLQAVSTLPVAAHDATPLSKTATSSGDDAMLREVAEETDAQSAVHVACSLVAEESSVMLLKMFADWLVYYPVVIATCAQSSDLLWSRLASMLNFLPTPEQILKSGIAPGGAPAGQWSQAVALVEDVALRGFAPLVRSQERLDYSAKEQQSKLEQAVVRILVLHKFGHHVASLKTAPAFGWETATSQFSGPAQRAKRAAKESAAEKMKEQERALLNRSKMMKAMAQQRLQSEVATLAEATAKQQAAMVTPFLIPDAHTLCTGLHLVKKLLKTEKFVVVIAKSVIEALDNMKKGRDNYAARDAIKFLEKELQGGSRFIQAQKSSETLQPRQRKPAKLDLQTWHFECLVDCAMYLSQQHRADGAASGTVATLILDKSVTQLLIEPGDQPEVAAMVRRAQANGVDVDTVLEFYKALQAKSPSGLTGSPVRAGRRR